MGSFLLKVVVGVTDDDADPGSATLTLPPPPLRPPRPALNGQAGREVGGSPLVFLSHLSHPQAPIHPMRL